MTRGIKLTSTGNCYICCLMLKLYLKQHFTLKSYDSPLLSLIVSLLSHFDIPSKIESLIHLKCTKKISQAPRNTLLITVQWIIQKKKHDLGFFWKPFCEVLWHCFALYFDVCFQLCIFLFSDSCPSFWMWSGSMA